MGWYDFVPVQWRSCPWKGADQQPFFSLFLVLHYQKYNHFKTVLFTHL